MWHNSGQPKTFLEVLGLAKTFPANNVVDPPTPIMQRAVNLKLAGYTRARGSLQGIENDDDICNLDDNLNQGFFFHTNHLGKPRYKKKR